MCVAFEFDGVGCDSGGVRAVSHRGVLTTNVVEERVGGHEVQRIWFAMYCECILLLGVMAMSCSTFVLVVLGKIVANRHFCGNQIGEYLSEELIRK